MATDPTVEYDNDVRYYVMVKEEGRWNTAWLREDLVEAFLDVDRILDQEYLYNAGNGVDVMVVEEPNVRRGHYIPVKKTAEIKRLIAERKELRENGRSVYVDTEAIEKEKPRWDSMQKRAQPSAPKEPEPIVETKEPNKTPDLSKAFLAWLKK